MKYRRIMIAAPKSGSGKTMITCALLQALKDRGEKAVSYKCGPDYIDPMFHKEIIGVPAKNLDTFFTDEEQTRTLFLDSAEEDGIAVLEGVMGIYDGLGGIREEGSSYHLAQVTGTPVILVVDAKGMGRSVIPLIAGFLAYDRERLIRGVILNRISGGYCQVIKPLIEKDLKIPVLGYLPERENLQITSRHLGLVMPHEAEDVREKLRAVSEEFLKTVSVEKILEMAKGGKDIETDTMKCVRQENGPEGAGKREKRTAVIAVARDEAFCFYYEDNIRMLQEFGAEIRYFFSLHDKKLPKGCQGLLLGGGYPELYAHGLSENREMRRAVRDAIKKGLPTVAECGGFMYLHSALVDKNGDRYGMVGVIPATCFYTGKLVRFGYVEIEEKKEGFLPGGGKIKGHEFHYYDSTDNGEDAWAVKPVSGKRYSCIMAGENYWIGFPHLYYPSNGEFVKRFVEKAKGFH